MWEEVHGKNRAAMEDVAKQEQRRDHLQHEIVEGRRELDAVRGGGWVVG